MPALHRMGDTLKNEWRKKGGALALAFGLGATGAGFEAAGAETTATIGPEPTLWKTGVVDAVISLRTCPETGICGQLHWVNPDDRRAFDYFGDQDSKTGRRPTRENILSLCDYTPRMQFNQIAPNKWKGTLHLRGRGMTVNMEATLADAHTLKVVASKAIFSERDTWTRVASNDPRYPRCKPH